MSVAVIIPYRLVDEDRASAFDCSTRWWALACPEFHVVPVDDGGDLFSRAASLNQGVSGTDAEVIVAADADVLISRTQILRAVNLAEASPGLVQPFDELRWFDRDATRTLLSAPHLAFDDSSPAAQYVFGVDENTPLLGGCNVLSRRTWEQVGGWDERYRGWGAEDIAFAQSCGAVAPTRRVPGPLMHLFHRKTGDYASKSTVARNGALLEGTDAP